MLNQGWYENFLLQLMMSQNDLAPIADADSGSIITENVCDKCIYQVKGVTYAFPPSKLGFWTSGT